jgi:chromosome segregation ATPase
LGSQQDAQQAAAHAEAALQAASSEREAALTEVELLKASVAALSRERDASQSFSLEMTGELAQVMRDAELPVALGDRAKLDSNVIREQLRALGSFVQQNRRALYVTAGERDRLMLERNQLQSELASVRAELRKLRIEEMTSTSELREVQARSRALAADLDDLRQQLRREREKQLRLERDLLVREIEVGQLNEAMRSECAQRIALLNSYSWKASAPFRRVVDLLRPSQGRR